MWNLKINPTRYSYAQFKEVLTQDLIDQLEIDKLIDAELVNDSIDVDTRKSKIKWLSDTKKYDWLYRRLTDVAMLANKEYFNFDLNSIEPVQFTVYNEGDFYGKHTDYGQTAACRKLSFTIQLTDPSKYEGGDLVLYNGGQEYIADKTIGTMTVFNSWMLHEVKPVTKGVRKSLVGWVTGPEWK
jgi:PKHD-type hydroxylase